MTSAIDNDISIVNIKCRLGEARRLYDELRAVANDEEGACIGCVDELTARLHGAFSFIENELTILPHKEKQRVKQTLAKQRDRARKLERSIRPPGEPLTLAASTDRAAAH